jgi:hypothetical protein
MTLDSDALHARLRPAPEALRASFERHRAEPHVSVEAHVRRLRLALGESVAERSAVYLDTRYWIFLRDAALKCPQQPVHLDLLSALRERVSAGRAFCPLSAVTFLELLKQSIPESRRVIAEIVDELSLGVALCDEYERMTKEICYLLSKGTAGDKLPPIQSTVWVRLPYVFGSFYPSNTPFGAEDELVTQKAFTDHLWDRSLTDMVVTLDGSVPPDGYEAIAQRLNVSNAKYADEVGTFDQTYLAEIGGTLELFAALSTDLIEAKMRAELGDSVDLSQATRSEREKNAHMVLVGVARAGKGAVAFPTLHAQAKCHAAIRRDKRRKLEGNDLVDFHHAIGAVVYCDAFLTERPLRTLITTNPVALDREFDCKVISDGLEALQYVRTL